MELRTGSINVRQSYAAATAPNSPSVAFDAGGLILFWFLAHQDASRLIASTLLLSRGFCHRVPDREDFRFQACMMEPPFCLALTQRGVPDSRKAFRIAKGFEMGEQEDRYVRCFYDVYKGRVALSVGYGQNMVEIFPFVMVDDQGKALGIVAMTTLTREDMTSVHIFHLSVFKQRAGCGSVMLGILCRKADQLNVILSLNPIPSPNGMDAQISSRNLIVWYRKFGFMGDTLLSRQPRTGITACKP